MQTRPNLFANQPSAVVIEIKPIKSELISKLNLLTEQIYNQINYLDASVGQVIANALRTGPDCTCNDPYQLKKLKQIVDEEIQQLDDRITQYDKRCEKTAILTFLITCLLRAPNFFTEKTLGILLLLGLVGMLIGEKCRQPLTDHRQQSLPTLNYINDILASAKDCNDELAKLLCKEKNPKVTMQADHFEQLDEVHRALINKQRMRQGLAQF